MKLKDYISGEVSLSKGSMKLSVKGNIDQFRARYDKFDKTKLKYNVYRVGERLFVHFKMPSETVDDFMYDVVIEFTAIDHDSIEDCEVTVFSNAPSFVYYSAYVLYHHDELHKSNGILRRIRLTRRPDSCLFVDGLENKVPSESITDPPRVRNPAQIPIPDKTVFYALFYILDNFKPPMLQSAKAESISMKRLTDGVTSFGKLMMDRKRAVNEQKRLKRNKEAEDESDFQKREHELSQANAIKPVSSPKRALRPKSSSLARSAKRPKTTYK